MISKLPHQVTVDQLRAILPQHLVRLIKPLPLRESAIIQFVDRDSANRFLVSSIDQGLFLDGHKLTTSRAGRPASGRDKDRVVSSTVCIKSILDSATFSKDELRHDFKRFGQVENVILDERRFISSVPSANKSSHKQAAKPMRWSPTSRPRRRAFHAMSALKRDKKYQTFTLSVTHKLWPVAVPLLSEHSRILRIHHKNPSLDLTTEFAAELRSVCETFGPVDRLMIAKKGRAENGYDTAFVTFRHVPDAEAAFFALAGDLTYKHLRIIRVEDPGMRNVCAVRTDLAHFGEVCDIRLFPDRNCAFVRFWNEAEATLAISGIAAAHPEYAAAGLYVASTTHALHSDPTVVEGINGAGCAGIWPL
ncbi:hypothetical protein MKEN_00150900 [Mycena kentingensis (nom. inval.)]|nr:hypothetical protein MKEN_00150900 [Mycena kentingensis (nom. inval.)]